MSKLFCRCVNLPTFTCADRQCALWFGPWMTPEPLEPSTRFVATSRWPKLSAIDVTAKAICECLVFFPGRCGFVRFSTMPSAPISHHSHFYECVLLCCVKLTLCVRCSTLFSFFLSRGANTQLNHWTKWVVSTWLITLDPRNWPILLNRYWGIVTVSGVSRGRAKGGKKESTSLPLNLLFSVSLMRDHAHARVRSLSPPPLSQADTGTFSLVGSLSLSNKHNTQLHGTSKCHAYLRTTRAIFIIKSVLTKATLWCMWFCNEHLCGFTVEGSVTDGTVPFDPSKHKRGNTYSPTHPSKHERSVYFTCCPKCQYIHVYTCKNI